MAVMQVFKGFEDGGCWRVVLNAMPNRTFSRYIGLRSPQFLRYMGIGAVPFHYRYVYTLEGHFNGRLQYSGLSNGYGYTINPSRS